MWQADCLGLLQILFITVCLSFRLPGLQAMRVKLQPPSGTELVGYNPMLPPPSISQVLLLANPTKASDCEKVVQSVKWFSLSGGSVCQVVSVSFVFLLLHLQAKIRLRYRFSFVQNGQETVEVGEASDFPSV